MLFVWVSLWAIFGVFVLLVFESCGLFCLLELSIRPVVSRIVLSVYDLVYLVLGAFWFALILVQSASDFVGSMRLCQK